MKKVLSNLGDKFGTLTIISDVFYEKGYGWYMCQCDCGNIGKYTGSKLRAGLSKRCLQCSYRSKGGKTPIEKLYYINITQRIKASKKLSKLSSTLTLEEFQNIVIQNCTYCGISPTTRQCARSSIVAHGVDRIDSSKGYVLDNCVSCCKYCNIMKSICTVKNFFKHVKRIVEFNNL